MGPLSPEKPRGRSPPKVPNDQATVVGDMIQVLPPETANREVLP
jgi:hypothetical protein